MIYNGYIKNDLVRQSNIGRCDTDARAYTLAYLSANLRVSESAVATARAERPSDLSLPFSTEAGAAEPDLRFRDGDADLDFDLNWRCSVKPREERRSCE